MISVFAASATFHDALAGLASANALQNGRFLARNFLLETELPHRRVAEYMGRSGLPAASGDSHVDMSNFIAFHNLYVADELRSGVRAGAFDPAGAECPQTFRSGCSLDEFGESDEDLWLVRVEEVSFIARQTMEEESDVYGLLTDIADEMRSGSKAKTSKRTACDSLLRRWQDSVDNRPLFSAFWDDAEPVVSNPKPGWAEELRDRLGLAHLDASRKPHSEISVVLFRYPVKLVPRRDTRRGPRFIVRPTVLDSSLSEAFYTAPPGIGVGSTVDLVVRDDDPWREVVHPAVEFKAEHVWATDIIRSSLRSELSAARGHHCLKVCVQSSNEFTELCQVIDGDLL